MTEPDAESDFISARVSGVVAPPVTAQPIRLSSSCLWAVLFLFVFSSWVAIAAQDSFYKVTAVALTIVLLGYLPGVMAFPRLFPVRNFWLSAPIYTLLGLTANAVLFAVLLLFQVPRAPVFGTIAVVSVVYAIRNVWRSCNRENCKRTSPALPLVMLSIPYLVPLSLASFRMGWGTYPICFFDFDTPYLLMQVHSLVRADGYPPVQLDWPGFQNTYHYGTQCIVALLCDRSGMRPHNVAFLIVLPLLRLATFAAAAQLCESISRRTGLPVWIALTLVLYLRVLQTVRQLSNAGLDFLCEGNVAGLFAAMAAGPDLYDGGIPIWGTQFGQFVELLVFFCIFEMRHGDSKRHGVCLAVCAGALIFFKSPMFLGLGLGLGTWSVYLSLRTRDWRPLAWPIAALLLALALKPLSLPSGDRTVLVFSPGTWLRHIVFAQPGNPPADAAASSEVLLASARWTGKLSPFLVLLALAWGFTTWREKLCLRQPYLWTTAGSFFFTGCFSLSAGRPTDILQVTDVIPLAMAALFATMVAAAWCRMGPRTRFAAGLCVLLITCPAWGHGLASLPVLFHAPERWERYMDNTELAEVLAPTAANPRCCVITNMRENRLEGSAEVLGWIQEQIPAIFGTNCYNCGPPGGVKAIEAEVASRAKIFDRLAQPEWDKSLEIDAVRLGWTHVVVDERLRHSKNIPLPVVVRNRDFVLYRFTNQSPPGKVGL